MSFLLFLSLKKKSLSPLLARQRMCKDSGNENHSFAGWSYSAFSLKPLSERYARLENFCKGNEESTAVDKDIDSYTTIITTINNNNKYQTQSKFLRLGEELL